MKWKQEATEKLRKYSLLLTGQVNLQEELERLESEAVSIKSATTDGTPTQGGGNRREDRMLDNIMCREELQMQMQRNAAQLRIIRRGLEALEEQEKHILQEMYISPQRGSKEKLMGQLGLSDETSLYKKAKRILHKFTLAMYGYCE